MTASPPSTTGCSGQFTYRSGSRFVWFYVLFWVSLIRLPVTTDESPLPSTPPTFTLLVTRHSPAFVPQTVLLLPVTFFRSQFTRIIRSGCLGYTYNMEL